MDDSMLEICLTSSTHFLQVPKQMMTLHACQPRLIQVPDSWDLNKFVL